jgi:hypothetical protein
LGAWRYLQTGKRTIKYNVKISGTTTTPVFVRAYPGALVTIDGGVEF